METNKYIEKAIDFCITFGPKILLASLILVLGWWLIKRITRGLSNFLGTKKVDELLKPFIISFTDTALKILLLFMVASTIGLETTSFIAIFSAIAFSIGLALQGSLGNFASGILILMFKPFKLGDWLTVEGFTGEVVEIHIFNTTLRTYSGKLIIIPNGRITENPVVNMVGESEVEVEATLLVNSNTSLQKLREVVAEVANSCPFVIPEKEPEVKILGISRDDIKVEVAVLALGKDNEEATFYLYEALGEAFRKAGIELAKERRREALES